jgi:hypothetical protein
MGGRIWVESEVGRGSSFYFTANFGIPSAETVEPRQAEPSKAERIPSSGRKLNILVAEDSKVNQVLVQKVLNKQGHELVVASNGHEALALLETQCFDLLLTDLQMPEMDGFELTAAIRTKERATGGHMPIIALTANAMSGDELRCRNVGMDGYLSKPISPADLARAVEAYSSPEPTLEEVS